MEPFELNPYGVGRCPECGADLATLDIAAHTLAHFPDDIAPYPQHRGAIARRDYLRELARAQELEQRRSEARALLADENPPAPTEPEAETEEGGL